jgi:molybdate transport system substrate-binding protein
MGLGRPCYRNVNKEADFGLYQLSAVMSVKGITVAGMLPQALQMLTVYGATVMADNASLEPAQAFIKFLADPVNHRHSKQARFESPAGN